MTLSNFSQISGLALLVITSSLAAAQISTCVAPAGEPFGLSELTKLVRDPSCQIKSVRDAIRVLPESMRSNVALFHRSQSLQGPHQSNFIYPRAILSSYEPFLDVTQPPRGMFLTFNGHPSQPGHDRLEIMDVNPQKNTPNIFSFHEISFPSDEEAEKLSWQEAQSRISFSAPNPKACLQCHGQPPRPIFQVYPIWDGAIGSRHLALPDSEAQGLIAFKNRHANDPKSRYFALNPSRFSERYVPVEENSPKKLHTPIVFESSIATDTMSSSLVGLNSIRMARRLVKMPFWNEYKFAIQAAIIDCGPITNYVPARTIENHIETIYSTMNFQPPSRREIHQIMKLTHESFQFGSYPNSGSSLELTIARHEAEFGNHPKLFEIWVDTMAKQGFDRIATEGANLRILIEGLGYNMEDWWIDLAQPTYRTLSNGPITMTLKHALSGIDSELGSLSRDTISNDPRSLCNELKSKSLERLANVSFKKYKNPNPKPYTEVVQRDGYPSVFKNTCKTCHVDLPVGPDIPFDNPSALKDWLSQGNRKQRLEFRTLHAPETQRMPPTRALSDSERAQVEAYLKGGLEPLNSRHHE